MGCVSFERRGLVTVATVTGTCVVEPSPLQIGARWDFRCDLEEWLSRSEKGEILVLDLSRITGAFCSSAVGFLIVTHRRLTAAGGALRVVPSEHVREIFRITQVHTFIPLFGTAEEAV